MIRTALIDDERDARQALRLLLDKHCPSVQVIGEATGITEAAPLIHEQKPDLLFLDISMQDGTGFDLLDQFTDPAFRVIFTTAFDNFAIKAFRYNALDYLLKPVDPKELVKAIAKVKKKQTANFSKKINGLLDVARSREFKKIALSSQGGLVFLKLDEIVHLEADGNYTTFHLINGERHVVVRSLKDFDELLSGEIFFRTHQSYIVNFNFVKKYVREGLSHVLMENGAKVPVARRRKDGFMDNLTGQSL